jgi:hypothetical protein
MALESRTPDESELPVPGEDRMPKPVAVVWCRQVDNEAESPGYTTVPDSFPGIKETLDTIRIVGNLTINVADTHDYWDPDPARPPLSYYPNLFLYPAYGGAYTCVGRMFLSTEDRPRLGMKTLVLDTQQLLATGEFGNAILRWHASMGSARSDGGRPPPVPDPNLYGFLGEGFLFHRGSTDPVVVVAAEEWEGAMQAIFDLVRRLPASLIALGAILAFPYFLPYAKLDAHEFTENLPLALALMRVPRGEALGERHRKRVESWETAPVTLRDFSAGVPSSSSGRGKEVLPLVLQLVRDGNIAKLAPIAQRVDFVELGRLKAYLADPDRQAGKDRRKEMWRIGTAMESAALLLGRARGRHVPVHAETAKRVQAYLNAEPEEEEVPPTPGGVTDDTAEPTGATASLPSWLSRPNEPPPPKSTGAEAVPVSVSEDPSLLSPPARATSSPPKESSGKPAESGLLGLLDAHIEDRVRSLGADEIGRSLRGVLDTRFADFSRLQRENIDRALDSLAKQAQESDRKLSDELQQRIAAVEQASRRAVDQALAQEMERRAQTALQGPLDALRKDQEAAFGRSIATAVEKLRAEVSNSVEELKEHYIASEEELRAALLSQMELQIREAQEEAKSSREETESRLKTAVKQAIQETEAGRLRDSRELEQRLGLLIDGRTRDTQEKLSKLTQELDRKNDQAVERKTTETVNAFKRELESRLKAVEEARLQSIADLQVRLQMHLEQMMRESHEAEREKYLELLARTRSDLQALVGNAVDQGAVQTLVREGVRSELTRLRSETDRMIEQRVMSAEHRLAADQSDATEHLETIRSDLKDQMRQADRLEKTIRLELDELDRRLSVLSDRLVPIVKQTWLRIAALEKSGPAPEEHELKVTHLRREISQEMRRMESETADRLRELRERMESSIASQGKVWLTLVRQLSQLTEDRRALEMPRAAPSAPSTDPSLVALDELTAPRSRTASRPARSPFDETEEEPAPPPVASADSVEETVERRRAARRSASR